MIKAIQKTSVVLILILASFLVNQSNTQASGTTTNSDTGPGQTVVQNVDGTMSLTTNVNPGETTPGATRSSSSRVISRAFSDFEIPTGFASGIGNLLSAILRVIMVIVALLVFYNLIMAGFNWLTSGGDKGKIESARNRITAAVIGIVIVAASWAILLLVLNFLGFSSLEDVFNNIQTISPTTSGNSIDRAKTSSESANLKEMLASPSPSATASAELN